MLKGIFRVFILLHLFLVVCKIASQKTYYQIKPIKIYSILLMDCLVKEKHCGRKSCNNNRDSCSFEIAVKSSKFKILWRFSRNVGINVIQITPLHVLQLFCSEETKSTIKTTFAGLNNKIRVQTLVAMDSENGK